MFKEVVFVRNFLRVHDKDNFLRGHSKSTFARNFQFLTPLPPLFVPVRFTCTLPPQRTFTLVSYPLPPLKKVPRLL